jgi:hypothetical protein
MIPSSFLSLGLKRESIISSLADWVCTEALYLDIRGHCRELTTYKIQKQLYQVYNKQKEHTETKVTKTTYSCYRWTI